MSEACLFCNWEKFELVAQNDLSYAIRDKYPVKPLHTLVLSKKHYEIAFDLPGEALASIFDLAKKCRSDILSQDSLVKGFNFGANAGEVAGQKIMHVHFHLIPRRVGDVEPPPATA